MAFVSILVQNVQERITPDTPVEPPFFADLNLDQIINSITAHKQDYNLKPFFYTPVHDIDTVYYRHEIMRDMESDLLIEGLESFAQKMVVVRRYLGLVEKLDNTHHKNGWFLEAVDLYGEAVTGLVQDLGRANLTSRGLLAFRDYLAGYTGSDRFTSLVAEARELKASLSTVRYCVTIKGLTVKVRKYEDETDYSEEVDDTFEKFKQGAVKDYRVSHYQASSMNHVEVQILDCVARLYPDIFTSLDNFCTTHNIFLDETISTFDREIQFYLAYLEFTAKLKQAGLAFCYPEVLIADKDIFDEEGFDLALANKRVSENSTVICNDFYLKEQERIIVVSGPNQGGKTTFARTFGQIHYLAGLGCPVPGKKARIFLCDQIFTHFEKEENIQNQRGKLQDDLVRIHNILDQATPNSLIIMNEIFTSTTLKDAVFLSQKIIQKISQLDLLCVCVTFLDELSSLNEKTVSMVSTVDPDNPIMRTFRIVRKPADGLAYALSIAEKYHLTYERLKERIQA